MKDKNYLIKFLLDQSFDVGARDDCAMDLADFNDDDVLQVLYSCATDPNEDKTIQGTCGESLAEIMVRTSKLNAKFTAKLTETALAEFRGYILETKPDWLSVLT